MNPITSRPRTMYAPIVVKERRKEYLNKEIGNLLLPLNSIAVSNTQRGVVLENLRKKLSEAAICKAMLIISHSPERGTQPTENQDVGTIDDV